MSHFPIQLKIGFKLSLACATLFAIAIPLWSGYSLGSLKVSSFGKAMDADIVATSSVVLLASTIPLMIDVLLDYNQIHSKGWRTYSFGRVPIALSSFFIGLQLVYARGANNFGIASDDTVSSYYSIIAFRIITASCIMFILNQTKSSIFCKVTTGLVTLFTCLISATKFYSEGQTTGAYHEFTVVLSDLGLIVMALILCRWCYVALRNLYALQLEDYASLYYLFLCLIVLIGSYFIFEGQGRFRSDLSVISPEQLAFLLYCYTFFCMMMTIVPGRIARVEAVIHFVSASPD